MKTFKMLFLVVLAGLTLTACQKDDLVTGGDAVTLRTQEEPQMVPFKGDFLSYPYGEDQTPCVVGDIPVSLVLTNSYLEGNATHIGILDPDMSSLTNVSCVLVVEEGVALVQLEIVFMNSNGDGLKYAGESTIHYADGSGTGYFEVVEGYGKFNNASGWMATVGNVGGYPQTFSAEGMVTQPNH